MTRQELPPLDRQGLAVGDRVQVLANAVRVPENTVGTIVGFSTGSDHPLVAIPGQGRFLIPALSLRRLEPGKESALR